jgi:hypothetical protein
MNNLFTLFVATHDFEPFPKRNFDSSNSTTSDSAETILFVLFRFHPLSTDELEDLFIVKLAFLGGQVG